MTGEEWPFDQPRNFAVFTIRQIIEGDLPITFVYHDADDHGWQFLANTETRMNDAVLVCLKNIVELDPSVLRVAHMPPGFHARREHKDAEWIIEETPAEQAE